MGTILQFERTGPTGAPNRNHCKGPAKVIPFSGVRYESLETASAVRYGVDKIVGVPVSERSPCAPER